MIFSLRVSFFMLAIGLLRAHVYAQSATDTLVIHDGSIPGAGPYTYLLEDTGASYGAPEVYRLFLEGGVNAHGSTFFNFGYSHSIFWVLVTVRNASMHTENAFYTVADPHLNLVELYAASAAGIRPIGFTGDFHPFRERPLYHKNFVFPVMLAPGEAQTLLLKIDNRGYTTMMPIDLQSAEKYNRATQQEYLLWGIVTGISVLVCIFSLFMYISLGDRLYFFYGLYVAGTILYIWSNNGLGYQFLWPAYPMVASRIRLILGAMNGGLILHNMQLFVSQNKANSRFYTATQIFKTLLFFIAAVLFIPYDFSQDRALISVVLFFSDAVFLGCVFVLFAGLIEKIIQKQKVALYYLLAILFFCAGSILILLMRQGILPASFLTINGIYIGVLAEVLILTFTLTRRFNIHTRERNRLREEILEKEKQEAVNVAVAKERERKRIAADMHDDLGAALSSLRLMSELTSRKNTLEELQNDTLHISKSAEELTFKMKEIVWTLDNESDNLENLLLYIQKYGRRFFSGTGIRFDMPLPLDIPHVYFSGEKRRHIHLAVKEIFHNILQHTQARTVKCEVSTVGRLTLILTDDGPGMDLQTVTYGNGLKNINRRMALIGGEFALRSENGVSIRLDIPLAPEPDTPNG